MQKPKSVLIAGSIALDTIVTARGTREDVLGGSTTYALLAAGRTAPVHVVGIVGTDFPLSGLDLYRNLAADISDLRVVTGRTFRWGGRYYGNGDARETLFTELGVFADFVPDLSPVNRRVPLLFLANIHPALQLRVIRQSRSPAMIVVDTMNLWITTTPSELLSVLAHADVLLINEEEAFQLAGRDSIGAAGERLQGLGPRTIVVKRGSRGAVLISETERISLGVFPVGEVVDPTGAGDTFGGGFMAVLARGGDLIAALVHGSALASVCVEGFGTESLQTVRMDEIQRREIVLRGTLSTWSGD